MTFVAQPPQTSIDSSPAKAAEKSILGAVCGEVVLPADEGGGLFAMNLLHIPKARPARRKSRRSESVARLELTLEMPRERPAVAQTEESGECEAVSRGVADVDFYI